MLRSGRERFPTGPGFVNGELVKDAKPDRKPIWQKTVGLSTMIAASRLSWTKNLPAIG